MSAEYCPECGGELFYEAAAKRFICKSCGLYVTKEQLWDIRQKVRDELDDRKKKRREHGEYLEWWLSRKKA